MRRMLPLFASTAALALILPQAACAQMQGPALGLSQQAATGLYQAPNSIQPETTLSISAEATVKREPDIAYINAGVQEDGDTATAAMEAQAKSMTGVFDALEKAGVAKKDMQTSNFSLWPRYTYIETKLKDGSSHGEQKLIGYTASNQLTVKVRDLDNLGSTLDSLVKAGGNTFNGLTFALDDDADVRDEARRKAMADARARADLYAKAAGLRVLRIVTINESGSYSPAPMAMGRMMEAKMADAVSTPMAGGEVGYSATVNVVFELGQ
ncbi:MAG: SIMPL domain-containing protein [Rhodobacterales bacterium]|nr:SIMPL domain-containing protein [Rhodobacterales bacterium]